MRQWKVGVQYADSHFFYYIFSFTAKYYHSIFFKFRYKSDQIKNFLFKNLHCAEFIVILYHCFHLIFNPLPIITIYFLGFPLDNIQRGIVKINREYRDVVTREVIDVKEDFVELLTHDSYLIQLRLLAGKSRTKLERILRIFSPEFQTEDPHQLNFRGELDEPLVKRMVDRLGRAMASDEIREIMDVEDEIDRIFERGIRKVTAEKDKIIAEKEQEIEAKAKALEAHPQALEAHAKALEAEKLKSEALLKELDALKQQKKQ